MKASSMKQVRNRFLQLAVIAVPLFAYALSASADTVVRTGETVSVAEDQGVTGDFYTAASIINISGAVDGDFIAAGGRTTLNGEVSSDALILGGSVDVHGSIGDDLRIVGGEVVIAEPVTGDVFVIGGSVSILSTASIGGDVLVFGGDVVIDAPVGGDIIGNVGTMRIDNTVAGNVDVTTQQLTLGDKAAITGTTRYVSANLVNRSPNATVSGEITRNDPVDESAFTAKDAAVPVLVLLFTVLVWFLIARKLLSKVVLAATARRPRPMLLGLGTLVLAPFAAVILLVSVLGTLVGIVALLVYILTFILALIAVSAIAGQLALKIFNQPAEEVTLFTLGAGVITTVLLLLIPVIGPLLLFGLFILAVGALVESVVYPAST